MLDTKTNITQTILDALAASGNKIAFMPDAAVVDAIRFVEENGIPNNKHEDYKYCNLEAVIRKEFKVISNKFNTIIIPNAHKLKECYNIFVVNGIYNESLSDKIAEVKIDTLINAQSEIKNQITIGRQTNRTSKLLNNGPKSTSITDCFRIMDSTFPNPNSTEKFSITLLMPTKHIGNSRKLKWLWCFGGRF